MGNASNLGRVSDLINHDTEWGVSVQESKAQQGVISRVLKFASFSVYLLSAFVALPLLIGFFVFPDADADGIAQTALIVLGFVALAAFFQAQSKKGPRNALQIDYSASEVRLGSQNSDGTFIRHRVCGFRHIEKVSVDSRDKRAPAICLHLKGEVVRVSFKDADPRSLDLLAAKISAARESARKAPIRSRVQTLLLGIDASYREVGQRVKSRVVSRAV